MNQKEHAELAEKHYNMKTVLRYAITYERTDGFRTMFQPLQGRYTFGTKEEAEKAFSAYDAELDGTAKLAVQPCYCYPGHFDPVSTWFDEI